MGINNPLIKAREAGLIINKTADIFQLLINKDEREERVKMANKLDTLKATIRATVLDGQERGIGSNMTREQVIAVQNAYDNVVNQLKNIFARTATVTPSTIKASFFNSKPEKKNDEPENTNRGPGLGR